MDATRERLVKPPTQPVAGSRRKQRPKAQTDLEYLATRFILGFLGALPRPAAIALGSGVGRLAFTVFGRLRRVAQINLRLAFPDKTDAEREQIIRGVFLSLGRQLGEFSQLSKATPESLREYLEYTPESIKHLEEVQCQGKGVIFLSGHLGAWELMGFGHSALSHPMSFMARPLDNYRVEEMVKAIRTRFGNRFIDKKVAARAALKVLREGGTLGILADLNSQPHEGVFVPFFGQLACMTAGVATLALRTDAIVMPLWAIWDHERRKYVVYAEQPVQLVRTGDEKQDIVANTARFASEIESMIRRFPDQWMWIHRRWKTRPPGEPDLYKTSK
jgi:KDO2-lipid IV(A) lauroyltransferase